LTYANWEDILISLVVGGLFFYLGRHKISDYYKTVSATDFMIFIFWFFVDFTFVILALKGYLGSNLVTGFIIIFIYNYWIINRLIDQREKAP